MNYGDRRGYRNVTDGSTHFFSDSLASSRFSPRKINNFRSVTLDESGNDSACYYAFLLAVQPTVASLLTSACPDCVAVQSEKPVLTLMLPSQGILHMSMTLSLVGNYRLWVCFLIVARRRRAVECGLLLRPVQPRPKLFESPVRRQRLICETWFDSCGTNGHEGFVVVHLTCQLSIAYGTCV